VLKEVDMMRIIRAMMRALRPRNLLAVLGLLVLVHVMADQVLLFQVRQMEQEEHNKEAIKDLPEPGSPQNAATLYQYAYSLNIRIDGELKERFPQIKCPGAGDYSCALDGRPCCSCCSETPPLSPEQLELYGGVFAAKQPVYDLISKATGLPMCVFSASYAPEIWQSANYEGSMTLREMMRLLSDKARWDVRHGDVEGAWENARQLLVCVERAGGNGSTSVRLVQQSLFQVALSTIADIEDQGPVPESVTAAYFVPLRIISDPQAALNTAKFLTAMYLQDIDLQMGISAWGTWVRPLASLDKLRTHEVYLQLQQALSLKTPKERMVAVKQIAEAEHLPNFLCVRLFCPWRLFATDPFITLWQAYDLPDSNLISCRMLEIGVALKQHKQRQGAYPQGLEEVAKELPADTTVDPVTDKPFEYRLEGSGFTLKSPGPKALNGGKSDQLAPRNIVWQAKN
jgi:hypothetical protein